MPEFLTVSDAARLLEEQYSTTIPPRQISDLFYQRVIPGDDFPLVGGRRLIPRKYLPLIAIALRTKGLLAAESSDNRPTEAT